jgi:hypothetical protein
MAENTHTVESSLNPIEHQVEVEEGKKNTMKLQRKLAVESKKVKLLMCVLGKSWLITFVVLVIRVYVMMRNKMT